MMNTEVAFLRAMHEQPGDASIRLVFADWLEERGDPRGELLRLLNTLTQSVEVPDRPKLEDRMRSLVASGVEPVGPFFTNSIGMRFALIWPGTFLMGSPAHEERRDEWEIQHKVMLTKGFYMGVHLVTQEQWQAVMGSNPSHFKGEKNLPVDSVSWYECQGFLKNLSEKYRLATEAEWEYACRAGTTTPFWFGETLSTDQANYNGNSAYGKGNKGINRQRTTPVGCFPANAWGLYDMHGNSWEWCQDWHDRYPPNVAIDPRGSGGGDARVLRGGSWHLNPEDCRSACRNEDGPGGRHGFRAVLTLT